MLPLALALLAPAADPVPLAALPANTWTKLTPLPGGPPSPGLGYEGSLVWHSKHRRLIRFAGHNQGGGGEQNAETWAFDPVTARWELKEPNTSPPGACCNQQNVFDPHQGRFLRFPAFSGSHGWQWFREIYLCNSTAWAYDLGTNTWRDRRPLPAPRVAPLRCASWDTDHQVAVVFGGEGSTEGTLVYDPYTNTWHRLNPSPQPAPRSGGNLAYDPAAKKHLLFGTQFDDDRHTWAFDLRANTWTDLRPKAMPPTDRNDPVLAFDPNARKVVAVVRAVDRSNKQDPTAGHVETWGYDFAANTWAELKPAREPDGWSNRSRVMAAAPELGCLLLESVVNPTQKVAGVDREQQVWALRLPTATGAAAQPPADVRVEVESGTAAVKWRPSPSAGVVGYTVERGVGETPWAADYRVIGGVPGTATSFPDPDPVRGRPAYYRVRARTAAGSSEASPVVRAQPRVADDMVAEVMNPKEVRLTWAPVPGAVGYVVERAAVEVVTDDQLVRLKTDTPPLAGPSVGAVRRVGPFTRVTREPIAATAFTDTGIDLTKTAPPVDPLAAFEVRRFDRAQLDPAGKGYPFAVFAYRVRAVNALGVEGGPSAWVLTVPGAVPHLFAREDGTRCHLRWGRVPGAVGYRVYRMEGPKINGPGQKVTRMTPEAVGATEWTDPAATTDTKRYWVVAVDRLGQEGVPSAPAWHSRQFRSYYRPFTGEWHQ